MSIPQVTIALGGRFHAFELAKQLERQGCLRRIITTNPRFTLKSETLDPSRIKTFPLAEVFARAVNLLTRSERGDFWGAKMFDAYVSAILEPSDAFVSWAGYCLGTMQKAKRFGQKVLLDRACPHILDQKQLVEEESRMLGDSYLLNPQMVDRMLREYTLADVILVPSEYSRKSFVQRGFAPERIKVLRLSGKCPPNAFPRSPKTGTFRVLHVGGNPLRKGLVYLLRAWKGLHLKNARLILRTSAGLHYPEIQRLLKDETIEVVSYQTSLASLYAQASVFCLPSVDDGFGMAVLEAMSYGVPVVVTRNVGASDCIQDGREGFVIDIRDVNAIQEKLTDLYEHPEKVRTMGLAAQEQAKQFTWEAYGEAFRAII